MKKRIIKQLQTEISILILQKLIKTVFIKYKSLKQHSNQLDVTDLYRTFHTKISSVQLLSCVRLFATPWTVACQASRSMEFSRQEYWSGLPHPSPGDLPNPRIEPSSPTLQVDSLLSEPPGKPFCEARVGSNEDHRKSVNGTVPPYSLQPSDSLLPAGTW